MSQQGGAGEEQGRDQAAEKSAALSRILDPAARMRLNNVAMVRPELASSVEGYLLGMASQGRLGGRVTDEQLKGILQSVQQPKREFRFSRV